MNDLTVYVLNYGSGLLYNALTYLGFGSGTKTAALNFFYSLMNSNIGEYIAIPIAIIFYLTDQIASVNVSIPNWVSWTYNYIVNNIQPSWSWLMNNVSSLISLSQNLGGLIEESVKYWVGVATSGLSDALAFATWLLQYGHDLLVSFINNPGQFIRDIVEPVISAVLSSLSPLLDYFNAILDPYKQLLTVFLNNPVKFIEDIFEPILSATIAPLLPLLQFLAWWQSKGVYFLVQFVEDPGKTMLDLIADLFIPWFLDLVNKVW